jgi:HlyD family secretion protein
MKFDSRSGRQLIRWAAVGLLLAASLAWTIAVRRKSVAQSDEDVPLARVQRHDLELKIYSSGELRAGRSQMLTAPPIGGGALQITRLLHTGAPVKKGEVVIEFDPSEQRFKLEQSRSELLEAEQEIIKAKADAKVQAAEDKVALLKARFDVRRAQLEVGKNELVSTIEAQKNQLALDAAKRALAQLEQDAQSHASSGQAGIGLAQEKWTKAKLTMDEARDNTEKLKVVSPMQGLVSIQKEMSCEFCFEGQSFPDYHVGDQVHPGSAIAEVIDPTQMELSVPVSERERGNVQLDQPVRVEFDALPGQTLRGKIKSVAGMAQRQFFWETDFQNKFDVSIELVDRDRRLRPGMTALVTIEGETKKDALTIPRQALFQKNGRQIVYVKNGGNFDEHAVTIRGQTESRAVIIGLKPGDLVAIIDPTAPKKTTAAGAPVLPGGTP